MTGLGLNLSAIDTVGHPPDGGAIAFGEASA